MLMIVFGAGASHDSAPDYPAETHGVDTGVRPPLANELFEYTIYKAKILETYTEVGPVFDDLSIAGRGEQSLEQALQQFRDRADADPTKLCQLAAVRFYLRDLISSIADTWSTNYAHNATSYARLLLRAHESAPKGEPILLVTFNYDVLIDEAVSAWPKHSIARVEDYVKHDRFKLVKLHGSTNWGREAALRDDQISHLMTRSNDEYISDFLINNADTFDLGDEYRVTRGTLKVKGAIFMPALSIPLERKRSRGDCECPQKHWQAMVDRIPDVDRILTIGWSAGDTYFLDDVLKPKLRPGVRLLTVGKNEEDARSIASRIQSHLDVSSGGCSPHGFTAFAANRSGARFMPGE